MDWPLTLGKPEITPGHPLVLCLSDRGQLPEQGYLLALGATQENSRQLLSWVTYITKVDVQGTEGPATDSTLLTAAPQQACLHAG